jgi:hypothetical protein
MWAGLVEVARLVREADEREATSGVHPGPQAGNARMNTAVRPRITQTAL